MMNDNERAKRIMAYQKEQIEIGLTKICDTTRKEFEKGNDVDIIPILVIGSHPKPYTVYLSKNDILYIVHIQKRVKKNGS